MSPFVGPQLPPKETPPITPGGGEKCNFTMLSVGLAQRGGRMLAEIFLVRLEAAARLHEQMASRPVHPE